MNRKLAILISSFAFILFSIGSTLGQPKEGEIWEEAHQLGRNLLINLVVEPSEESEGFSIVTATEDFQVQTKISKDQASIELHFEGKVMLRDSKMVIGETKVSGPKPILVAYRLKMQAAQAEKGGGFDFALVGSVLLDENEQVVIAKSKDMTIMLKISGVD